MAAEKPNSYQDSAEAASGGLPQLDFASWPGQIFWLVVTFTILYFVLAKFILPKIGAGLSERSDHIADDLDLAARFQKEAQEAEKNYLHELAQARAKAQNVAETTRKSIDAEIASEIATADAELNRQAGTAEARIKDMRNAALGQIDNIAQDTTLAIFEKLIQTPVTDTKIKAALKAI